MSLLAKEVKHKPGKTQGLGAQLSIKARALSPPFSLTDALEVGKWTK